MATTTPFLTRLGLAHPLIQAPMAGVSGPALAAAVSNAGALGSLGLGAASVQQAQAALEATAALTTGPVNVNVFCHRPAQRDAAVEAAWLRRLAHLFARYGAAPPQQLTEIYASYLADQAMQNLLLAHRPAVVSFHFGLPPQEHIAALRAAGIYTMATATSLDEAEQIEAAGVDAVVAQGIEAGGHRGVFDETAHDERLTTWVLVRLLVKHTRLPVIAAGGIMDGQGVRAALDLGAVAAQLGTAFVPCTESLASTAYRQALMAKAPSTGLTDLISGRPARGLPHALVAHLAHESGLRPPAYPVAYDAAKQLHQAASQQGDGAFEARWAGQGAALARALPAADLIRLLAAEMGPAPAQSPNR